MVFRVTNLPKINGMVVRCFKLKENALKVNKVGLRDGIDLSVAANKLGVKRGELKILGVDYKGIDMTTLRSTLSTLGKWEAIRIRKGEERNAENLLQAVVGRLGKEEEVLLFDLKPILEDYKGDYPSQANLLFAYAMALYPKDIISQNRLVDQVIESSYPDNPAERKKLSDWISEVYGSYYDEMTSSAMFWKSFKGRSEIESLLRGVPRYLGMPVFRNLLERKFGIEKTYIEPPLIAVLSFHFSDPESLDNFRDEIRFEKLAERALQEMGHKKRPSVSTEGLLSSLTIFKIPIRILVIKERGELYFLSKETWEKIEKLEDAAKP